MVSRLDIFAHNQTLHQIVHLALVGIQSVRLKLVRPHLIWNLCDCFSALQPQRCIFDLLGVETQQQTVAAPVCIHISGYACIVDRHVLLHQTFGTLLLSLNEIDIVAVSLGQGCA